MAQEHEQHPSPAPHLQRSARPRGELDEPRAGVSMVSVAVAISSGTAVVNADRRTVARETWVWLRMVMSNP